MVIRREPPDAGELAWMQDDRTFCWAAVREGIAHQECGPLPKAWPRVGVLLVRPGMPFGDRQEDNHYMVFFAIVEGGHGPYHYTGGPPSGSGPVREGTAAFASGRTVGLLTYERPFGRIPTGAEICSADNSVCFPAYYPET
ncbi:hypothetical protein [Streptomyces sp.]|uniref:hypothetical protein n=1 Tax=Streptomyces sp. TaxID=1931 RepID=UPI002D765354|nr:hypothetical protein [Streptomyces sp.]HET6356721.1 hypothetical protein [Streptomyces sp.]